MFGSKITSVLLIIGFVLVQSTQGLTVPNLEELYAREGFVNKNPAPDSHNVARAGFINKNPAPDSGNVARSGFVDKNPAPDSRNVARAGFINKNPAPDSKP